MEKVKLIVGSEAEEIAGFLLWQLSRLWQRRLALALKDLKLPVAHAVVLANVLRLSEEGREISQAGLSKAAKTDRTTTSLALRALERRKLVTRVAPKGDLRALAVAPTARGRELALEVIRRFASAHETFFQPIAGKENPKLVKLMRRLIKANDLGS